MYEYSESQQELQVEPSSPPTVAPVSDGGTVEGKVLYRGWGTQGARGTRGGGGGGGGGGTLGYTP